jgi:methenyltetrahydrofolate cyclohydrolase
LGSSDLSLPLPDFLDAIARETPTPGGGSVSAVAAAMAAGLVEMAARYSHRWDEAPATAQRAAALRDLLLELARADAVAYEAVLLADPAARAEPLARATEVPARIAEAATEVAELAERLLEHGNRNLEGDAFAAAQLAAAVATAAGRLVTINREAAHALVPEPTSGG